MYKYIFRLYVPCVETCSSYSIRHRKMLCKTVQSSLVKKYRRLFSKNTKCIKLVDSKVFCDYSDFYKFSLLQSGFLSYQYVEFEVCMEEKLCNLPNSSIDIFFHINACKTKKHFKSSMNKVNDMAFFSLCNASITNNSGVKQECIINNEFLIILQDLLKRQCGKRDKSGPVCEVACGFNESACVVNICSGDLPKIQGLSYLHELISKMSRVYLYTKEYIDFGIYSDKSLVLFSEDSKDFISDLLDNVSYEPARVIGKRENRLFTVKKEEGSREIALNCSSGASSSKEGCSGDAASSPKEVVQECSVDAASSLKEVVQECLMDAASSPKEGVQKCSGDVASSPPKDGIQKCSGDVASSPPKDGIQKCSGDVASSPKEGVQKCSGMMHSSIVVPHITKKGKGVHKKRVRKSKKIDAINGDICMPNLDTTVPVPSVGPNAKNIEIVESLDVFDGYSTKSASMKFDKSVESMETVPVLVTELDDSEEQDAIIVDFVEGEVRSDGFIGTCYESSISTIQSHVDVMLDCSHQEVSNFATVSHTSREAGINKKKQKLYMPITTSDKVYQHVLEDNDSCDELIINHHSISMYNDGSSVDEYSESDLDSIGKDSVIATISIGNYCESDIDFIEKDSELDTEFVDENSEIMINDTDYVINQKDIEVTVQYKNKKCSSVHSGNEVNRKMSENFEQDVHIYDSISALHDPKIEGCDSSIKEISMCEYYNVDSEDNIRISLISVDFNQKDEQLIIKNGKKHYIVVVVIIYICAFFDIFILSIIGYLLQEDIEIFMYSKAVLTLICITVDIICVWITMYLLKCDCLWGENLSQYTTNNDFGLSNNLDCDDRHDSFSKRLSNSRGITAYER